MLLSWKPVVKMLKKETQQWLEDNDKMDAYVALFLLSDDQASEVYVSLKSKYAQDLGIFADVKLWKDWSIEEVLEEIRWCNTDPRCLGIMVQLPLWDHLVEHKEAILEAIDPSKDIDGLTSAQFGRVWFGYHETLWATPKSALAILDHYELWIMKGKYVLIVSQSNLIGKQLTVACMQRGATVISANHYTSTGRLAELIAMSEIIFSATWVKHLISWDSMRKENAWINKVFIDIGRGNDEDGPYGDMDREFLQDKVKAITPVPGGVGPVTVACLFDNITTLS